ncbi:uncharacterized protein LOC131046495 [Cryptomeria japonica]|uniref:uncharacterized protein LOC131046495 n=1 Tax=Cryptomeria japonica TaxID=3369 RepID=UPI0027DA3E2B|nr:uncharacterized protein LOC131046495 [Cryptomeria japonica]
MLAPTVMPAPAAISHAKSTVVPAFAKPATIALGLPMYAAAMKPITVALGPPMFVVAAALWQSVAAKPTVQLPVSPITTGETALPSSMAMNGGSTGVLPGAVSTRVSSKDGNTVLSMPSTDERDAYGLRPMAVPQADEPLVAASVPQECLDALDPPTSQITTGSSAVPTSVVPVSQAAGSSAVPTSVIPASQMVGSSTIPASVVPASLDASSIPPDYGRSSLLDPSSWQKECI